MIAKLNNTLSSTQKNKDKTQNAEKTFGATINNKYQQRKRHYTVLELTLADATRRLKLISDSIQKCNVSFSNVLLYMSFMSDYWFLCLGVITWDKILNTTVLCFCRGVAMTG